MLIHTQTRIHVHLNACARAHAQTQAFTHNSATRAATHVCKGIYSLSLFHANLQDLFMCQRVMKHSEPWVRRYLFHRLHQFMLLEATESRTEYWTFQNTLKMVDKHLAEIIYTLDSWQKTLGIIADPACHGIKIVVECKHLDLSETAGLSPGKVYPSSSGKKRGEKRGFFFHIYSGQVCLTLSLSLSLQTHILSLSHFRSHTTHTHSGVLRDTVPWWVALQPQYTSR